MPVFTRSSWGAVGGYLPITTANHGLEHGYAISVPAGGAPIALRSLHVSVADVAQSPQTWRLIVFTGAVPASVAPVSSVDQSNSELPLNDMASLSVGNILFERVIVMTFQTNFGSSQIQLSELFSDEGFSPRAESGETLTILLVPLINAATAYSKAYATLSAFGGGSVRESGGATGNARALPAGLAR